MVKLLCYPQGIYAIDSGYIRPLLAAIHLIVENDQVAIVDTASNAALPRILEAVQQLRLSPKNIVYVVLTHIHLDHAGGAGAVMQAFPEAQLIVHPRGVRHMADPSKLFAAVQAVYGETEAQHLYGELLPIEAERIISAEDGFSFELAGRTLTCLETPGHASHHLCLCDSRSGCLFTGDIFGMSYRELDVKGRPSVIPTTTPTQFDPVSMHASVNRVLAQQPEAVYLAHFSRVEEVPRLGDDLHRLIDAHVSIAEQARDCDADERSTQIENGLWALMDEEAARQGWVLSRDQWRAVLAADIRLNAQGLDYWASHSAG